ncbi:MAG: sortase [Microbacterium sp.]
MQDQHDHGTQFGVMFVPRFGPQWQFTIASGTSRTDILDQGEIGHYTDTAMPGGVGNTVYAAHRWTSGAPLTRSTSSSSVTRSSSRPRTAGTPTGSARSHRQDTQVEVLLPVPQQVGVAANGRYLTLTSCAPKLNMLERIIAYAVFESFIPRHPHPASLAAPTQGASS